MTTFLDASTGGPHGDQPVVQGGAPLESASQAMVLMHGRGGAPEDMLALADHLALTDLAVLAPQAAGRSWWPQSFLAPLTANEPGLSSGIGVVATLLEGLAREGFGPERIVLGGFSQGACLAVEVAARLAQPFHAVAVLSGGLVGTDDIDGPTRDNLYGYADKIFDYGGRLDGVPILLGCHARDPHIPLARVHRSAEVLRAMGAVPETMILPGAGHGVVEDEMAWIRRRLIT